MLDYLVCAFKSAFPKVFVPICVGQVAAVFSVVFSVMEVPCHVWSGFLMGEGRKEGLSNFLQLSCSSRKPLNINGDPGGHLVPPATTCPTLLFLYPKLNFPEG